jgi:hypothetical protein
MDGIKLPHFSVITAAIVACVIACAGVAGLAQTAEISIGFGGTKIGAPPSDFDFPRTGRGGPGRWIVVSDPTANGGRAVEQASTDTTDYRFPLAVYRPLITRNVEVEIRFKPVAGRVDRAGGIAVRLNGPNNYYVVRANALEDNVRFYRMVKGRRQELKSANVKVPANVWHTLALRAEGDRFTVTFEGKQLFAVVDKTHSQPGKVALWTKADSVTRVDHITIRPLP